jgi:hypothetical protein
LPSRTVASAARRRPTVDRSVSATKSERTATRCHSAQKRTASLRARDAPRGVPPGWPREGVTSRGVRRHVRGSAAAWSTLGSVSFATGSDARGTRDAPRGVGRESRRLGGVWRGTAGASRDVAWTSGGARDASRDVGGTSRRTRAASPGMGGESRGVGGTSQGTRRHVRGSAAAWSTLGSVSRGTRTVAFAARCDARRVRGRALALRGASLVRSYCIVPIASRIATKTLACSRKSERSARGSKHIPASVSACSRDSGTTPTNG